MTCVCRKVAQLIDILPAMANEDRIVSGSSQAVYACHLPTCLNGLFHLGIPDRFQVFDVSRLKNFAESFYMNEIVVSVSCIANEISLNSFKAA